MKKCQGIFVAGGLKMGEALEEGRPMKEQVQIPFAYKNKWKTFAKLSAQLVEDIEKKPKKGKK